MLCSVDVTTAVCRRQYGKMLNPLSSLPSLAYSLGGLFEQVTASPHAQQTHASSPQWAVDAHQSKRLIQSSLYWGSGPS